MKQLVFLFITVFGLLTVTPAAAADSETRMDHMEQQISLFSIQLEMMRAELDSAGSRLDTMDDMEFTLLRMEQNLRQMRKQLRDAHYDTQSTSTQSRPMMVHATW